MNQDPPFAKDDAYSRTIGGNAGKGRQPAANFVPAGNAVARGFAARAEPPSIHGTAFAAAPTPRLRLLAVPAQNGLNAELTH
jgi:hypothetical protein